MILTPHAVVGATLANLFPNDPALGFGLTFLSHYALDILPHTEYNIDNFLDKKSQTLKQVFKNSGARSDFSLIIVDITVATLICALFFVRNNQSLFLTFIGIVGGLLPDLFQYLYFKFKRQPWIFFQNIHNKLHKIIKVKHEHFWGTFLQIIIPIIVLTIYFIIKK